MTGEPQGAMTDAAAAPPVAVASKPSVADAYVLFAVVLLLVVIVGSVVQLLSLPVGLVVTEVVLILLPAVVYVRLKRLPVADALGWRPIAPGLAVRAVILGCTGWGAAMAVETATDMALAPVLGPDPMHGFLARALPRSPGGFAMFLVIIAVLPGICEETLFRGALQGTLEKKGAWKAVAIAAALFALLHVSPWSFVSIFALGVFFGAVAARTGSALPSMICHACNNAVALTAVFVYRDRSQASLVSLVVVLTAIFVIALIEFIIYTRRIERAPSPLVAAPANLSRRLKIAMLGCAVAVPVLLVAAAMGCRIFFRGYRMTTDDLAPEVALGDRVIVLRSRWSSARIKPGDVVVFSRGVHTPIRRVARTDETTVWVIEKSPDGPPMETPVPRADVAGRMIYNYSLDSAGTQAPKGANSGETQP